MGVTTEMIEQLLYEEESSSLDFKQEQYPFAGASDTEKSELLKDILAFTNAWRRTDAHILIGVQEVRGGRSIVVGVTHHLDDAQLQQFVNSKTQQPVFFSYQAFEFEGNQIGVIHIPLQTRPIYITRNYGMVQRDTVCVRRGSSTAIADPDEIAKMGAAMVRAEILEPLLDVQFANTEKRVLQGNAISVQTTQLRIPDAGSIPDYGVVMAGFGPFRRIAMPFSNKNREYFRELAEYFKGTSSVCAVNFAVMNGGMVLASDVRLEILVDDPERKYILLDEHSITEEPSKWVSSVPQMGFMSPDVTAHGSPLSWVITATLGKIQPKRTVWSKSALYVGARESCQMILSVNIYADNITFYPNITLTIDVDVGTEELALSELVEEKIVRDHSNKRM